MDNLPFSASNSLFELPALPSADPDVALGDDWDLRSIAHTYRTRVYNALEQQQELQTSGRALVLLHTQLIDRFVRYVFAAGTRLYARRYTSLSQRCCLFAVGGYGRSELNPHSDIDLLFLYHWKITPFAETLWETIYYCLMDAGWKVGHAVRNIRECIRHANKDTEIKTTLLDSRYLCGDHALSNEFEINIAREVVHIGDTEFIRRKKSELLARHKLQSDSPYLVEPNVKEGCGGLRDLHTAWWLAKVNFDSQNLRSLSALGVVREEDLITVEAAQDFLWRVRSALHLLEKSGQDNLTFERQDYIAPRLGFDDATDLMRTYYRHVTTIHEFAQVVLEKCLATPRTLRFLNRHRRRELRDGVSIIDDSLQLTKPEILRDDPTNFVTMFRDAQIFGLSFTRDTKEAIKRALNFTPELTALNPAIRDIFLSILSNKRGVAPIIRSMHELGVLTWLLPEFGHLKWHTQRDLYHIYAIDEHTLHGIRELDRLRDGVYKETLPLLTQVMREIDRTDLLFLAMLFHDVGKGFGVEHSERSASFVTRASKRWQMSGDDAHEWGVLVRQHLFMSHIAQRRDLSDDTQIAAFARAVENPGCLKRLYLLTFADMKAVGPKVWNSWKASLLEELYLRTLERFEKGVSIEEDQAARIKRRKSRIARSLSDRGESHKIANFMEFMPDRYFLTTPEQTVPEHFDLINKFETNASSKNQEPFGALLKHFEDHEYSELTLVTFDRRGLFSMLAGVLAASGLSISGARIATGPRDIALGVFRLAHLEHQELILSESVWNRFYTRLGAVLRGEQTTQELVEAAKSPAFLRQRKGRGKIDIRIDNATSPTYTLIDITAFDRVGLLFDVTQSLLELNLSIHLSKITTNVEHVLDVFYVTDQKGEKVYNTDQITSTLQARLLASEQAA